MFTEKSTPVYSPVFFIYLWLFIQTQSVYLKQMKYLLMTQLDTFLYIAAVE